MDNNLGKSKSYNTCKIMKVIMFCKNCDSVFGRFLLLGMRLVTVIIHCCWEAFIVLIVVKSTLFQSCDDVFLSVV